ncbi:C6 zinc finger domain-containing protein [Colletotrichum plurivorum]|uniref:C6 zinc finger domain-containing protein n=1 Tax=Colletotrichum plurivorum TaxID=2175906 RepID=A0A8H6K6Z0_9PEZI|nr:C6 zinc finger domain-containing protein [Colletotrichum plurivorum]
MALRADDNPLSYPLLEHLVSTPSLLHAVQSISAGQERFFDQASLPCLKQRGLTLQALRREMRNVSQITPATLVAIFLQAKAEQAKGPADEGAAVFRQNESPVRVLAIDTLDRLFRCSIDTPAFNFHATPLLTAAAELRRDEMELRDRAVNHFKVMYSTNRVVVNMWAIDLVREVWEYNDAGTRTTWLDLLRLKDWTFTFA